MGGSTVNYDSNFVHRLTCSSWKPDLDGQTCAVQDMPFQEQSDDTSSTITF